MTRAAAIRTLTHHRLWRAMKGDVAATNQRLLTLFHQLLLRNFEFERDVELATRGNFVLDILTLHHAINRGT